MTSGSEYVKVELTYHNELLQIDARKLTPWRRLVLKCVLRAALLYVHDDYVVPGQ
jgi:hypothetical protein